MQILVNSQDTESDSDTKATKPSHRRNIFNKEAWEKEYPKVFKHSFNIEALRFEPTTAQNNSGLLQHARAAHVPALQRMFSSIPNSMLFADELVNLGELRQSRSSLKIDEKKHPCFEDRPEIQSASNLTGASGQLQSAGCMQFIKSLKIQTRTNIEIVVLNPIMELNLNNKKSICLPPLCSRGAKNWMKSIVQSEQVKQRAAQLLGYRGKLAQLVGSRWLKVIQEVIFLEKSFERQWNVLEMHFDPNVQFTEAEKWTARCTLAYIQDHAYTLLRELIYLIERISFKNRVCNVEISTINKIFEGLERDTSVLPYPLRRLTDQEEGKEVFKLCTQAKQAGCIPYRRFLSRYWEEPGLYHVCTHLRM